MLLLKKAKNWQGCWQLVKIEVKKAMSQQVKVTP